MIVHDVEQGSADWFARRMGIPTASCFDQIITPVTGKLSKSANKYAYRLICERLLKEPMESIDGQSQMERGREMEPAAVRQYEFVNDVETVKVGFITTDDGMIGASPDRIIKGKSAGLEVKSPSPPVQLRYLLEGHPVEHRPQVQGQNWICEFDYVDFYAFHPKMPPCPIRTGRDEPYIALLRDALEQFNIQLLDMVNRARELGAFQAYEEAKTPVEVERAHQLREDIWDNGLAP